MSHFNVLVIGAGTAGIMVASQLRKKGIENIVIERYNSKNTIIELVFSF